MEKTHQDRLTEMKNDLVEIRRHHAIVHGMLRNAQEKMVASENPGERRTWERIIDNLAQEIPRVDEILLIAENRVAYVEQIVSRN